MVMKTMLIGLLVIASATMLARDASAYHCPPGIACPWFCYPKDKDLEKLAADFKQNKDKYKQVLIVGYFDPQIDSTAHDSMSQTMDTMRERLKQLEVQPDSIRELMLEGHAPNACEQTGQIVVYLR